MDDDLVGTVTCEAILIEVVRDKKGASETFLYVTTVCKVEDVIGEAERSVRAVSERQSAAGHVRQLRLCNRIRASDSKAFFFLTPTPNPHPHPHPMSA
jgi:hypothetical protein